MTHPARQFWILFLRGLRVLVADRVGLLLLVLQAPVIAGLVWLAFTDFEKDDRAADEFSRVVHFFQEAKQPYEKRGDAVPVRALMEEAWNAARASEVPIGISGAQRRASFHFVLVSAAIWIGLLGSCREIVGERALLNRETRVIYRVGPYLLAKFAIQALAAAFQVATLAFLILRCAPVVQPVSPPALPMFLVLWLVAVAAATLGLLVSSAAPTLRAALTLVPVLMMPQLLFGGLLRPSAAAVVPSRARSALEHLTLQRWGFEAALRQDVLDHGGVAVASLVPPSLVDRYADLNVLTVRDCGLRSVFFNAPTSRPLRALGLLTLGLLVLTWANLWHRYGSGGRRRWLHGPFRARRQANPKAPA